MGQRMSQRIDKSWLVFLSIENFEHDRCVDLFSRPDGTHGFEEFRRDAEDRGAWTPVQYTQEECIPPRRPRRGCKAIGGVVGRSNPAESLGTKIAAANFKLKSAARFGKLRLSSGEAFPRYGPSRHFAATQTSVAFGAKRTSTGRKDPRHRSRMTQRRPQHRPTTMLLSPFSGSPAGVKAIPMV